MPEVADLIVTRYGSHERYWRSVQVDPLGALQEIIAALKAEAGVVFLKVFPNHLQRNALSLLLQASTGCIALTRNPLSSWTSVQLAERSGEYTNVNNTNLHVKFDPDRFARWGLWLLDFIEAARAEAARLEVPCVSISYQDLLELSASPSELWAKIRATIPELPNYSPKPSFVVPIRRQDYRSPVDRVENPSEAAEMLRSVGLDALLKEDSTLPNGELRTGLQNMLSRPS
jgi:hypothetical protein